MRLKYEPSSEPLHISYTHPQVVCILAGKSPRGDHKHAVPTLPGREFFIDNRLVRIHFIIVMIRWTGLAPWVFEFPFPGSLTSILPLSGDTVPF